jgi:hypothetical protein
MIPIYLQVHYLLQVQQFTSIPQSGNDTLVAYLDSGSGELKFSNIIDGGSF